jgi:hypothetical protein
VPYVRGEIKTPPHEAIYLRKFDQQRYAIRRGDYKQVVPFKGGKSQLYNLKNDIGETKNLALQKQDVLAELGIATNNLVCGINRPNFFRTDPFAGLSKKTNSQDS